MMHERLLVQLAVDGDSLAFSELARRYRGLLRAAAYSVLRSPDEADDVAQEAICRIFTSLKSFRGDTSFGRWAHTIARNAAIGRLRSRCREIPLEGLLEQASDVPSEINAAVRHAVESLPERLREPVLLHYMDGYATGEIADFLDIPAGTVRAQLTEARKVLRKELIAMLKRVLTELIPQSDLNVILTRLQAFPVVQPEIHIMEAEGLSPAPDYLEDHWLFTPLRLRGEVCVGFYDYPERRLTDRSFGRVLGETEIGGMRCFEVVEADLPAQNPTSYNLFYWTITDDQVRLLAVMKPKEEKLTCSADPDWDWGEHTYPRYPAQRPMLKKVGDECFEGPDQPAMALAGTYDVKVGETSCRCLRVIHAEPGVLVEAYVNADGRTVLWRRYNTSPEWSLEQVKGSYPKGSVEYLKESGCHTIVYNGIEYVHWYDCLTDVVLS